jgi:hypothetical protein
VLGADWEDSVERAGSAASVAKPEAALLGEELAVVELQAEEADFVREIL